MKRFLVGLFTYLRVGVGSGFVLLGLANAAFVATAPSRGHEEFAFVYTAVGLPLLLAGLAKWESRRVS
jgi:hypothetical protein